MENKDNRDLQVEIANIIWDIAGLSPECGNAVMDLLGEDIYRKIAEMQKNNS